jgi:hypothetical protein
MRLDRNEKGRGKYAIINLRKVEEMRNDPRVGLPSERVAYREFEDALELLQRAGVLEYGEPGTENEFFVIKLKDMAAGFALNAYARVYLGNGKEHDYARDVEALSRRAGPNSPWCKKPD